MLKDTAWNAFYINFAPNFSSFLNFIYSPFDQYSMDTLTNHKLTFTNASSLQFYTDGSLSNLGSANCRMGIAWLQTDQTFPPISFNATLLSLSPSANLAELVAITAAVFVAPSHLIITICTDSLSTINTYNKILLLTKRTSMLNPIFKFQHFPIWLFLFKLILDNNLDITFIKVTAHSDDQYNNQVDCLAKVDAPSIPFQP